jgi:hypothetical protein
VDGSDAAATGSALGTTAFAGIGAAALIVAGVVGLAAWMAFGKKARTDPNGGLVGDDTASEYPMEFEPETDPGFALTQANPLDAGSPFAGDLWAGEEGDDVA